MQQQTNNQSPPADSGPKSRIMRSIWMIIGAVMLVLFMGWYYSQSAAPRADVAYSQFKTLVAKDEVASISIQGDSTEGSLKNAQALVPGGVPTANFRTQIPAFGDQGLLPLLESHGVTVSVRPPDSPYGIGSILISLIPWALLFAFLYWSYQRTSQMVGGGLGNEGRLNKFLQAGTQQASVPDIKFEDVAGQENAKREVAELVQYLRNPEKFTRLGAQAPRGVLLMGPPGIGKTLLARALAGEAGVPFFSISGSQFIEVFVGVGASRVRNLFEAAKEHMPSIVFIDELDSIGRTRGTGLGGGHDEREQTLNQILAEMDGFSQRESVLVLAATNRPDILDPALLRPGRFDRHVILDLPSREDRLAILKLHTRKIPLAADVDLPGLAGGTPGFSGADLHNLANEAAILAARKEQSTVTMRDMEDAKDKLLLGSERRLVIQPDERHRLAVHESGHAVVAYYMPEADPLHKVTIIPRGRSLGETQQLPENERYTLPENYLRDRLAVMLAGRAAERQFLGSISSGADDDIRGATSLARTMVSRWGMSSDVGPVDLRQAEDHPFLGREIAQPREFSEHSAEVVDTAIKKLLVDAEKRATETLATHARETLALVAALEKHETMDREEVAACLTGAVEHAKSPVPVAV